MSAPAVSAAPGYVAGETPTAGLARREPRHPASAPVVAAAPSYVGGEAPDGGVPRMSLAAAGAAPVSVPVDQAPGCVGGGVTRVSDVAGGGGR